MKNRNPFLPYEGKEKPLKRNAFDLSHMSLFTTEWGQLYPCLCQEVIPGDTFKITPQIGFQAMPTLFPLQSRVRLSLSLFYVRNRTLQKNFEDMIFKVKDIPHPYLRILTDEQINNTLKTGSLGDALGVPTTIGDTSTTSLVVSNPKFYYYLNIPGPYSNERLRSYIINQYAYGGSPSSTDGLNSDAGDASINTNLGYFRVFNLNSLPNYNDLVSITFSTSSATTIALNTTPLYIMVVDPDNSSRPVPFQSKALITSNSDKTQHTIFVPELSRFNLSPNSKLFLCYCPVNPVDSYTFPGWFRSTQWNSVTFNFVSSSLNDATSLIDKVNPLNNHHPFYGGVPKVPINALPFRAYTSVCNYYFRNDLNNPYVLNGEAQYNQFIPTDGDGADDSVYKFHYHNWELDRYVSALPSPQFGEAPLVGISWKPSIVPNQDTAEFSFTSEQGDVYKVDLGVDRDSGQLLNIVNFDPAIPSSTLRDLTNVINAGFNINTFRNVNAFQRFYENMFRRSLRYRNQLLSHFKVNVDYPDIDVPQYIGGFSSWSDSGRVTNMADSPNSGLGDFIGTLQGQISGKEISCYCPEHGFIIGIFSIYPVPVYQQNLDSYLRKIHPFDYYTPEFSKLGFTSIPYSEVSPLLCNNDMSQLTKTFGYQRMWYEYMSSYDRCHGDFRTSLRDFLIQRIYAAKPELSESFIRVRPDDVNNIFVYNNIADDKGSSSKFLCQASFKITALRQMPIHGVPSLE